MVISQLKRLRALELPVKANKVMQRARQLCFAGCIRITLIYPLPPLKWNPK
jgi:hypothetical protein